MVVKKVTRMNPGDGVTSYANNSTLQKVVIIEALPLVDETLKEMLGDHHGFFCRSLKMVDLGCSSGPNPIFIISHILHTLQTMQFPPPDHLIEVFLNDLPDNDFNNLFKLVSTAYRKQLITKQCFVYGLPGSFYGKLFPTNTLHFAYSFYSLHWLSQIPEGLEKMNKENVYIARTSPPEVWEAYAMQYERDLSRFLALRGDEIVVGGRMVLTFVGRSVEDPTSCQDDAAYLTLLSQTLADMVAEGVVKMEDLYSFNVPIYLPCCGEVERVIREEGSFSLQKMQAFRVRWDARTLHDTTDGDEGKMVADSVRAFMEPMLGIHFGFSTFDVDQVFARYAQRVAMYLSMDNHGSYFTLLVS